jgi:hypothetical protein
VPDVMTIIPKRLKSGAVVSNASRQASWMPGSVILPTWSSMMIVKRDRSSEWVDCKVGKALGMGGDKQRTVGHVRQGVVLVQVGHLQCLQQRQEPGVRKLQRLGLEGRGGDHTVQERQGRLADDACVLRLVRRS